MNLRNIDGSDWLRIDGQTGTFTEAGIQQLSEALPNCRISGAFIQE